MAASTGAFYLAAGGYSPAVRCSICMTSSSSPSSGKFKPNPTTHRFAVSTEQQQQQQQLLLATVTTTRSHETISRPSFVEKGRLGKQKQRGEEDGGELEEEEDMEVNNKKKEENLNRYVLALRGEEMEKGKSVKDYFDEAKDFIRSPSSDGAGPPRWFSPLETGSRLEKSPLLLFLPGVDGVGLGLVMQHRSLGKIFDIWCLHIPVKDRTSFRGLVDLVERTVRSEKQSSPNRPIYLVGESLGACLALAVAARNPDIDLALVLANPATSFENSQMQPLITLLEIIPDQYQLTIPYMLSLMTGDPLRMAMNSVVNGLLQQTFGGLSQGVDAMSSYLSVLADILPRETLLWKLEMLKSASAYANSRLHAVKAQTLILCSGKDQLLPSKEEGQRLSRVLQKSDSRHFQESGHFLFLENGVDLATILKGAAFYRQGKYHDYVSDFVQPTPSEFKKIYNAHRFIVQATSPVMFSTLDDGKFVKGLAGIPSEGPVLFVGYHMLLGFELVPLACQLLLERNILVRGIAHPMLFAKIKGREHLSPVQNFDSFRVMGAVPVSGTLFYKLMSSKSHVLLYPGGMREACHRKGEEYKLFWPERSEFVRMAARFGAKIVPFGVVGEDDFAEVVFDYDDQMKIPFMRDYIKRMTKESVNVRPETKGEVGNQDVHFPVFAPKVPGRFYYYFGKPIETAGRKRELRDREKAHELYLKVKSEVENCLEFLKEKREGDPYRNVWTRLAYQAEHGFDSEVPTFKV